MDCFVSCYWLRGLFCVLLMVTWTVLSSGDGYVDCFEFWWWLCGLFWVLVMVTCTVLCPGDGYVDFCVLVMVTCTVLSSGDGYVDCFVYWWWLRGLFWVLVMVTWTVLCTGDGYVDCFVSWWRLRGPLFCPVRGCVDCFESWWWLHGLFCVLVMVMWTVLSYGDGYMDIYVLLIVTYFAVFGEWGYFIVLLWLFWSRKLFYNTWIWCA